MCVVERAPALCAQRITRLYETSGRGVSEVSLEIQPGEVFGLLGPNGSGKSTLLRVLSTAIAPDSGTFRVGYADGLQEKREVRAKIGLMVDRPTHYGDLTGWAEALCDRVAFLHRGRLVAQGTPEALISSLRTLRRIVARLHNPIEYAFLEKTPGVERAVPEGRDLVVHCVERPGIVADVVAGIVRCGGDIVSLSVERPNLEDVYVKLTGEALHDDEA